MSKSKNTSYYLIEDQYEEYYTEKFWTWIPEVYRARDGEDEADGTLRALVKGMGVVAAESRRKVDRLWEDQGIENCDPDVVPEFAALLGAPKLRTQNERGQRASVAKVLEYRRRGGTVGILEAILRDVTPWDGVVAESFRRFARSHHGLDNYFFRKGPQTQTPGGGTADLRNPHGADLIGGPFDEFAYTPNFAQHGLEKVNLHYYRHQPYRISFATPFNLGVGAESELGGSAKKPGQRFTFDPSGRDVPLFRPNQRQDYDECRRVREWEVADRIPCRLLADARYDLNGEDLNELFSLLGEVEKEIVRSWIGARFKNEARLRETLLSLDGVDVLSLGGLMRDILKNSLSDDSAKGHLWPTAIAVELGETSEGEGVGHEQMVPANLQRWGDNFNASAEKEVAVDPEKGRFLVLRELAANTEAFVPVYHYGALTSLGAGPYERRASVISGGTEVVPSGEVSGVQTQAGPLGAVTPLNLSLTGAAEKNGLFTFSTSKTYLPELQEGGTDENVIKEITTLAWQAENGERPYVLFKPHNGGSSVTFRAKEKEPAPTNPETNLRTLTLDGLWFGIEPDDLEDVELIDGQCPPRETKIVLEGVWDRILIRNCTIDPGGQRAQTQEGRGTAIPYVKIEVAEDAIVEELRIENSITGPVTTVSSPLLHVCELNRLCVNHSVVQSLKSPGDENAGPAISAGTELEMYASTVQGDVIANQMSISNSIIDGRVRVANEQQSCFRYSFGARMSEGNTVFAFPRPYESVVVSELPEPIFVSNRFGDPGYFQLSRHAPLALQSGAEGGLEMGVYQRELRPVILADLRDMIDEFSPLGVEVQLIDESER